MLAGLGLNGGERAAVFMSLTIRTQPIVSMTLLDKGTRTGISQSNINIINSMYEIISFHFDKCVICHLI